MSESSVVTSHRRVVVFDIGGVLVSENNRIAALSELLTKRGHPIGTAELEQAYWRERDRYDLGLDEQEYWSDVLGIDPGFQLATELGELDGACNSNISLPARRLLAKLHTRHSVALLSNAPRSMAAAVAASSWRKYVDVAVFSCEPTVLAAKPDPKIYRVLENRAQVAEGHPPIFIDDRPTNVEAANRLGWLAHQHTDWTTTRQFLMSTLNDPSLTFDQK